MAGWCRGGYSVGGFCHSGAWRVIYDVFKKANIEYSGKDALLIKMAETSDLEHKMIIKVVDQLEEKLLSDFDKKYIDICGGIK